MRLGSWSKWALQSWRLGTPSAAFSAPTSCNFVLPCSNSKTVHDSLTKIDPGMASWDTRIIGSADWLHEWLDDFEAIVARYEANKNKPGKACAT